MSKPRSLMKLAADLGVSFSAAKIISEHAQPEVDEKFIEDWTVTLVVKIEQERSLDLYDAKEGIRQLLTEAGVKIKEANDE